MNNEQLTTCILLQDLQQCISQFHKVVNYDIVNPTWRENLKKVAPCTSQNHLNIKQKGLCTIGGYLQGIRRITAEFEFTAKFIASIDCGVTAVMAGNDTFQQKIKH